jgi:subfamily B ATP-binding cassette protein MsbA
VDSIKRLIPFLYPHRRRLAISIVFGLLVAVLWGGNITAVFPLVEQLLQKTSPHERVANEIKTAEAEAARRKASFARIDAELSALERAGRPEDDAERIKLLQDRVDNESKLHAASRQLLLMKRIELHVLPLVPRNEFQAFALIVVLLMAAELIKGVCVYYQDVLVGGVVQRVINDIREKCLMKVLALDYQTLAADGTGTLMSRFTFDIEQVSSGIIMLSSRLIREPLKSLTCMLIALWINWRLTLLSILFLPLLALFLQAYGRMLKRASRRMMESMSRIYKVLEETLDGLKVVIAFGTAERHRQRFSAENERYFHKSQRLVKLDALAKPTMELLGLSAMFIAMLPGAYLVIRGQTDIWGIRLATAPMSAAGLIVLYGLLVGLLDPCRKMSASFSRVRRCTAALDRIFELMDRPPLVREAADAIPLPRHSRTIEFRGVTFEYPAQEQEQPRGPALREVNLTVPAGEVVAIVGRNGCGKSTLVNLLPRLYDAQAGEVLIDDVPLGRVRLHDLRSQIGLVTQETILFDDTILENIRYGKPDATREEVEVVARQARVMEIVESVPHGFETGIGERGRNLSGGQRQRIALARAMLRDPAILILDEATSASDAHSEAQIHEALETFVRGRTVFIITHAMTPSLLGLVTRVVVMDAGQIIASGTHEQLLQSCPLYERLVHARTRAKAA